MFTYISKRSVFFAIVFCALGLTSSMQVYAMESKESKKSDAHQALVNSAAQRQKKQPTTEAQSNSSVSSAGDSKIEDNGDKGDSKAVDRKIVKRIAKKSQHVYKKLQGGHEIGSYFPNIPDDTCDQIVLYSFGSSPEELRNVPAGKFSKWFLSIDITTLSALSCVNKRWSRCLKKIIPTLTIALFESLAIVEDYVDKKLSLEASLAAQTQGMTGMFNNWPLLIPALSSETMKANFLDLYCESDDPADLKKAETKVFGELYTFFEQVEICAAFWLTEASKRSNFDARFSEVIELVKQMVVRTKALSENFGVSTGIAHYAPRFAQCLTVNPTKLIENNVDCKTVIAREAVSSLVLVDDIAEQLPALSPEPQITYTIDQITGPIFVDITSASRSSEFSSGDAKDSDSIITDMPVVTPATSKKPSIFGWKYWFGQS